MKRLLIAALLCAGCATAPKEPEQRLPEVGTAADDATLVQAFVQQQQAQSDALFHPAAGGRKVRARLEHPDAPTAVTSRHPFLLRFTDFDVLRHVNNAVYWAVVEDELARRRDLRAPLRAELEHRVPIDPGTELEVVVEGQSERTALWLRDAGGDALFATATVVAREPSPATAGGRSAT